MSALPERAGRGNLHLETRSPDETRRLGAAITPILVPGDVIVLSGDLGAGKTTFVQGMAAGLKVPEKVTSPTFVLMKEYEGGRYPLVHLDIYRLNRMQEVIDLGYEEFLDPSAIVAIEWGDVVEPLLPREHLQLDLSYSGGESARAAVFSSKGRDWQSRLETIRMLTSEIFSPSRDEIERGLPDDPSIRGSKN